MVLRLRVNILHNLGVICTFLAQQHITGVERMCSTSPNFSPCMVYLREASHIQAKEARINSLQHVIKAATNVFKRGGHLLVPHLTMQAQRAHPAHSADCDGQPSCADLCDAIAQTRELLLQR